MSIRFKITNPIVGADAIKIYRALTPIPDNQLPTVYATLAPSATEYVDDGAVRNILYYYRVEVSKGGETVLSPNKPLMYLPDTGPGPSKILRGDYELGYFGPVAIGDVVTANDFVNIFGLTWPQVSPSQQPTHWLKFIHKGKILFFPNRNGLFNTVSAAQVYSAGLMYGTDDNTLYLASLKTNYGVVKQVRPFQVGAYTYIARCPISRADRRDTSGASDRLIGGEIDMILAPAFITRSKAASFPEARQVDDISVNTSDYYHTCDGYGSSSVVSRGTTYFDGLTVSTLTTASGNLTYRPVLELVF